MNRLENKNQKSAQYNNHTSNVSSNNLKRTNQNIRQKQPVNHNPRTDSKAPTNQQRTVNKVQGTNQRKNQKPVIYDKTKKAARPGKVPEKKNKQSGKNELNRKIIQQTPKNRQEQKKIKKISGSPNKIEINRRNTKREQFRIVNRKKMMRVLINRIIMFLAVFAVMFSISVGVFFLNLYKIKTVSHDDYTIQIGVDDSEDTISKNVPYNTVYANNEYYINIDDITELCEFTVTGDKNELRYIPRQSVNQTIRFETNTGIAYVNGVKIRMPAPAFISGDSLYVPISFFKAYVDGIVINHNEDENKITITRYVTQNQQPADSGDEITNNAKENDVVYTPITFLLNSPVPLQNIAEADITTQ